jgi:hypothetical protein
LNYEVKFRLSVFSKQRQIKNFPIRQKMVTHAHLTLFDVTFLDKMSIANLNDWRNQRSNDHLRMFAVRFDCCERPEKYFVLPYLTYF